MAVVRLVLVLALVLSASGCAKKAAGASAPQRPSKEEFIAATAGVCARLQARMAAVPRPTSLVEVPKVIDGLVPPLQTAVGLMKATPLPDTDNTVVLDMYAAYERAAVQLRRSGAAAQSGDEAQARDLYLSAAGSIVQASQFAQRYGIGPCVEWKGADSLAAPF